MMNYHTITQYYLTIDATIPLSNLLTKKKSIWLKFDPLLKVKVRNSL